MGVVVTEGLLITVLVIVDIRETILDAVPIASRKPSSSTSRRRRSL